MRARLVAITFLLLAAFPPLCAAQSAVAHVAVLGDSPSGPGSNWRAFVDALRERGWVEGRNLAFDVRSTEGRAERYPELAAELVALRPDLIIAETSQETQAVIQKTDTIPIVMSGVADPVASRFVASLARPGGNVTGLSAQLVDTTGKTLQLLVEARPGIWRVGLLWAPDSPGSRLNKEALVAIAPRLGVTLEPVAVNAPEDFDAAFAAVARTQPDALLTLSAPLLFAHRQQIIAFALDHRLPAIGNSTQWARDGLLMSFGEDIADQWRRAAYYVDRILKGAKPADLPVEQPTKFEFVINLKTAREIGLELPALFVGRADEVIE
jgi:putative tryptophan/tyrosine transport system substrate-binding protein